MTNPNPKGSGENIGRDDSAGEHQGQAEISPKPVLEVNAVKRRDDEQGGDEQEVAVQPLNCCFRVRRHGFNETEWRSYEIEEIAPCTGKVVVCLDHSVVETVEDEHGIQFSEHCSKVSDDIR